MGRRNQIYLSQTDFRGGINTEPENARANQVLDARNVWAPEGRLESRPGYVGQGFLGSTVVGTELSAVSATTHAAYWDTNGDIADSGTGVVTFGVISAGEYVGMLATAPFGTMRLDDFSGTNNNNTSVYSFAEYWDGTRWVVCWIRGDSPVFAAWSSATETLITAPPGDMGTGVPGVAANLYAMRAYVSATTDNVGTAIGSTSAVFANTAVADKEMFGTYAAQFPVGKRYFGVRGGLRFFSTPTLVGKGGFSSLTTVTDTSVTRKSERPSLAVVPQFNKAYLASGFNCVEYDALTDTFTAAAVETEAALVGEIGGILSPYNPALIAQLDEWPRANYWLFFKGTLISAHQEGAPFTVRWSAPGDAYKVWPEESFEYFGDDDRSPITGLRSMGEHAVVFREDSIWLLVDSGVNDLGLQTFRPIKVVDGIGCVANGSIQKIGGRLVFMAEDGIYAFDGTNAEKISGDIDSVFTADINKSLRKLATSVHYKTKNAYIITVPSVSSDTPDLTLVYDYKHGAWWRWDSISAVSWVKDENATGDEYIAYVDEAGFIYLLQGDDDFGSAITSYVQTQRLGYKDRITKRFRNLYVEADNNATTLTAQVAVWDQATGTDSTVDMQIAAEAKYGTAKYGAGTYVANRRRERRGAVRKTGEWVTVKITNSNKGVAMRLHGLHLGALPLGKR